MMAQVGHFKHFWDLCSVSGHFLSAMLFPFSKITNVQVTFIPDQFKGAHNSGNTAADDAYVVMFHSPVPSFPSLG
jgi:hypothetical protein